MELQSNFFVTYPNRYSVKIYLLQSLCESVFPWLRVLCRISRCRLAVTWKHWSRHTMVWLDCPWNISIQHPQKKQPPALNYSVFCRIWKFLILFLYLGTLIKISIFFGFSLDDRAPLCIYTWRNAYKLVFFCFLFWLPTHYLAGDTLFIQHRYMRRWLIEKCTLLGILNLDYATGNHRCKMWAKVR